MATSYYSADSAPLPYLRHKPLPSAPSVRNERIPDGGIAAAFRGHCREFQLVVHGIAIVSSTSRIVRSGHGHLLVGTGCSVFHPNDQSLRCLGLRCFGSVRRLRRVVEAILRERDIRASRN